MSSPIQASGTSPALAKQSSSEDQPSLQASLKARFDILKFLGAAGNSSYFSALDLAAGRPVRLKVLSDDAAEKELFYLEAAAAAKLSHQNITPTTEAEELGGIHFSTIEQSPEAESLRGLLDIRSWLEIDVAVSIALQVADALDYAHRMGVLHLNLNPANILIEGDGRVLVTDFGISADEGLAWAHAERSGRHCLQYASPEQIQGSSADPGSDLYSLGVVLFEMLTDRVPFDSADAGMVKRKHLTQAPHPPQLFRPGISNYLSALVLTLLEKNPDWRFRSAAQLQMALSKVAPGDSACETVGNPYCDDNDEEPSRPEPQAVDEATRSEGLEFIIPQTDRDAYDAAADNIPPPQNEAAAPVEAARNYVTPREVFEPPTIIKIDPPEDIAPERRALIEPQKRVSTARESVRPFSLYVSSDRQPGRKHVFGLLAIIVAILLLITFLGRDYLPGLFMASSVEQQNNLPDAVTQSPVENPAPADSEAASPGTQNETAPVAGAGSPPAREKVAPLKRKYVRRPAAGKVRQSARRKFQTRRKARLPLYLRRVRGWTEMLDMRDWLKLKES
jgi:serine/threonine protein kinase